MPRSEAQGTQTPGSPFFCLLFFGEAKKSELLPGTPRPTALSRENKTPMLSRLNSLPRDARDTLFLLLVIAWVLLPQVNELPLWCSALAALFAAVPLMLGFGEGAELRQPLGLSIFGGLIVSQMLTLFTTPVIYLGFDRLGQRFRRKKEVLV